MTNSIRNKLMYAMLGVFVAACFVFGICLTPTISGVGAEGETEITFPTTFAVSDWSGNTELRLPTTQFSNGGGSVGPSAEALAKVKITRGETVYSASHVYCWGSKLTFYFNDSGYTGLTATSGDVLSIDSGFAITQNGTNYICTDGISWSYNGEIWLNAAYKQIAFPETFTASDWNGETELRLSTGFVSANQADLSPTAEAKAAVVLQRGETVYACSYIYEWSGKLTFYFNGSGYTGKTGAVNGDKLTVKAGFTVTANGQNYYNASDVEWTYNGTSWSHAINLDDYTTITPTGVSWESASYARWQVTFDGAAELNQAATNANAWGYITVKNADGTSVTPSHLYSKGTSIVIFTNNVKTDWVSGDMITVLTGCGFNADEKVKADVTFVYDGTTWYESDRTPATASAAETVASPYAGGGFLMRVDVTTNAASLGGGSVSLNGYGQTYTKVTYKRGDYTVVPGAIHANGYVASFYFKSSSDLVFTADTSVIGDIITIDSGFQFADTTGKTYQFFGAKSFIYNGTTWIAGTELNVALQITGVTVGADTPLCFVTSSANTTNFGDSDYTTTNIRNYFTFTYPDGTEIASWFCRVNGNTARFFVKVQNSTANINTKDLLRGMKMTAKAGFEIVSGETLESDVTYTFDGVSWVEGSTLPVALTVAVSDSGTKGDTVFFVTTDSTSTKVDDGNQTALLNYVSFTFPDGTSGNVWYARVNGSEARFFVYKQDNSGNIGKGNIPVNGIFTVKKGFKLQAGEVLLDDVSYIYTAEGFVALVEPTAIDGDDTAKVYIGKEFTVTFNCSPETANAPLKFALDSTGFAEIKSCTTSSVTLTGKAAGTVALTATYGTLSKEVTVTVAEVPTVDSIEISGSIAAQQYDVALDYSQLTATYKYSDGGTATVEITNDMITAQEGFSFDKVGNYTFTLTASGKSAQFGVEVKSSVVLSVSNIDNSQAWNGLIVTFDGGKCTASNISVGNEGFDAIRARMLPYIEVSIAAVPNAEFQGNTPMLSNNNAYLFIQDVRASSYVIGDTITFKKGLGFLADERLATDVTWVFNGTKFVELVEPDSFDISASQLKTVHVGALLAINVDDDDAVTAVYKYSVSNDTIAKINVYGVLTGLSEGKVNVTVSYGDVSKTVEITVLAQSEKVGIEVVDDIEVYYVPVSAEGAETSFVKQGYTLTAHYVFEDGSVSEDFELSEEAIGSIDYTTAGVKQLTVTDPDTQFTDTITVKVYDYVEAGVFNTVGVGGYDVNDSRNAASTWNGHMVITMSSWSTNSANLLSTSECGVMAEYITYTTTDGKVYSGSSEADEKRVGIWMLGSTMLVMIKPDGYTGNMGFGVMGEYGSESATVIPVYLKGDKITFKKGMPLYAWHGEKLDGKPVAGKGCMVIEGYLDEDYSYYCYEQDDVKSLWQFYKEYTDFSVKSEIELAIDGTASIGAVRVPANATIGTFTYASSDSTVVTVNANGNMVGMKVGTATITVTLSGGFDADGNAMEDIVKTITVTVKRAISSVIGSGTIVIGSEIDLGNFEVTVSFSDGTSTNVKLNAEGVVVEELSAETVGETVYNVVVTVDGETKRGTFTLTVSEESAGGCGSVMGGSMALCGLLILAGAAFVAKKK